MGTIKRVRDGLDHRTIRLKSGCGMEIEASGEFQRLKQIKTLGLSYLVYPSSTPNRYSHCLGTANLAKSFAEELEIPSSSSKQLFFAMLLHDLGHGPYSHATEGLGGMDHEERTAKLITGDLKMPRKYCGKITKAIYESGIDPAEISNMLAGNHSYNLLNQLVSGYFDLDKADYLRRDSNLTALIGGIDIERMCDVLTVFNGKLCVEEKGFDSFMHFINARKNMYRNVYNHPDTALFEGMLVKAIKSAKINPENMWFWTDSELEASLASTPGFPQDMMDMFNAGMCYNPVFMIDSNVGGNLNVAKKLAAEKNLEEKLAKHAKLKKDQVIVCYKIPEGKNGKPYFPMLVDGEICNTFEYNKIAAISEKRPRTLFYAQVAVHPSATPEQKEKVKQMAEDIANAP